MTDASAGGGLREGLAYAAPEGKALPGDLYLPAGSGPFPALVAVHGGGWQRGTRKDYRHWGRFLAGAGYALFAIDYRLAAPGVKMYPQSVEDVGAAVEYLRNSAAELNLDPARLGLIGDSAGAHLAALAALTGTRVKAVVGIYGVYDMIQQWSHDLVARPQDQIVQHYLGVSATEDRRLYFEASPLSYAVRANNQTAFLLAFGTEDEIVDTPLQSIAFATALRQAGFYVRSVTVQSAPHFWASDPLDETGSHTGFLAPRLHRFLAERL
jgi:acetyl esterase/lipase